MFININHFKSVITAKFFVEPADINYYFARWAIISGFYTEFYWQSAQAIEKYLKASLVLNGISVIKASHNIPTLFDQHLENFHEIQIKHLQKPDQLHADKWEDETVDSFVRRIARQGSPDIRYGQQSWHNITADLFKLDQLVFYLRRTTIGEKWIVGDDWEPRDAEIAYVGKHFTDIMLNNDRYSPRSDMIIRNIPANIAGNKIEDAMYAWNFCFYRDESDIEKLAPQTLTQEIGPTSNSYLFLLHENIKRSNKNQSPLVKEGVEWLISNIKIPKDAKEYFQKLF